MISGEKGEFRINPKIFWKGDAKSRKDLLKDKAIQITFGLVDKKDCPDSMNIESFEE